MKQKQPSRKERGERARVATRYRKAASKPASSVNVADSVLYQFGDSVVVRRKIAAYQPPPGVIPSIAAIRKDNNRPGVVGSYLAMDSVPVQNGINFLNQQGCGLGFPGYAYLSELSQRSEYRAPSETISNEMTRKFVKFISRSKDPGAAEKFKKLEAAFKKFDVRQVLRKALELDLFFGRAQIYVDIEGQDTSDAQAQPLTIDKKTVKMGSLKGFKVIEPIWTSPLTYNSNDPTRSDFYVPQAWYVLGRRIHATRLLTIISRPVADMLKPAYNFGGISLTQLMEPYVLRWLETVGSVNRIINNFSVMILKTNMQTIVQGKSADATGVLNRAKLFTKTRSNSALTLLDKDSEEMQQIAVPLGGLSELQAQAQEHMAAPSHVPLVKLTGITPSGLNASSEGEITVFHEFVGAEQENFMEPPLDVMFDLIQLNEFGSIDEDLDYEFVPLVESTTKEVSDIRKANAEMVGGMIDKGLIDAEEGREFFRIDPESGWSHLSAEAPEPQVDPNVIDPETNQPYAPQAAPDADGPPKKD